MKTLYVRINDRGVALAQTLSSQQKVAQPEIVRRALDIGLCFLAASSSPDASGTYGGELSVQELADILRPYGLVIADFLARYSHALPGFAGAGYTPPRLPEQPVSDKEQALDPALSNLLMQGSVEEV